MLHVHNMLLSLPSFLHFRSCIRSLSLLIADMDSALQLTAPTPQVISRARVRARELPLVTPLKRARAVAIAPAVTPSARAIAAVHLRRPKKWQKLVNLDNIARDLCTPCCALNHVQYFSAGEVRDARAELCRMSEQAVSTHLAAMLTPMRVGGTVVFHLHGRDLCRRAFAVYFGVAEKKMRHAIQRAQGCALPVPFPALPNTKRGGRLIEGMLKVTHASSAACRPSSKRHWLIAYLYQFLAKNCDTHQSGRPRLCAFVRCYLVVANCYSCVPQVDGIWSICPHGSKNGQQ